DALAVVDPRRDLDIERSLFERATGTAAGLTRVLDDAAAAAALWARRGADELSEEAARHLLEPPGAAAARTGRDARSGLDAVAAAGHTLDGDLDGHARRRPPRGVHELDLDLGRDVAAARRAAPRARSEQVVAEERAEEIADVAEVEVARREAARAQPRVAVAVVELTRLGVRQYLVSLCDLAEAHLRVGLLGDVGMKLPRELAEGALDLLLVRFARDAEQLVVVVVARCHRLVLRVHLFDEPRQLVCSRAHRAKRLLVVHPQRAEQADRAQRVVRVA